MIPGRLVALKKSQRATQIAHRKLRRRAQRTGEQLQDETLEAGGYVILFTTLPKTLAPTLRILKWYRLRWQIDLAFKRMKSIMNLGQLPKHVAESSRAWLHGKLLVAQLVERLIEEAEALSPWGYP